MTSISIPRYRVLLDDPAGADPVEHVVEVRNGDQLRAELEGAKRGLTSIKAAPMHYTTLWCWASLARTGDYAGNFTEFAAAAIAIEPIHDPDHDPDDPDAGQVPWPADPTQPDHATDWA